jgi:hypothetical protein
VKEPYSEVLHSVARGLESTRDFWWRQSSGINQHHSTTERWARAVIVPRNDHIRVQLGDGSRYTITIEEDLL